MTPLKLPASKHKLVHVRANMVVPIRVGIFFESQGVTLTRGARCRRCLSKKRSKIRKVWLKNKRRPGFGNQMEALRSAKSDVVVEVGGRHGRSAAGGGSSNGGQVGE